MAHWPFDHFAHTTATDPHTGDTVTSYSLGSDLVITSHPDATQAPIVLTTQLDSTMTHGKPVTALISYPWSYDVRGHDGSYFVICYANGTTLSHIITHTPHATDTNTSPPSTTIAYIADERFFDDVDELPAVQVWSCLTPEIVTACEQREVTGDITLLAPPSETQQHIADVGSPAL